MSQLSMNYLGIKLESKSKYREVWSEIIQKLHQKLYGWKRTYLSKRQRLVLIQSVLASLPMYYLSTYQMPVSVGKEI